MGLKKTVAALVLVSAAAFAVFGLVASNQKVAETASVPPPYPCERPGPGTTLGPALTIEEAEREASVLIGIRSVPFGYANQDWLKLKVKLHPRDNVHSFEYGDSHGGYIALRSGCIVGQLTTWMS